MHLAVYLALALAALIGRAGRLAARRLAPRPAAFTVVTVAAASAACWLWALGLLAVTLLDRAPSAVDGVLGLRMANDPVPAWVGLTAAMLLGAAVARLLDVLSREIRRARALHGAVAACPGCDGDLVVVADPVPRAFALPSFLHPGRIVVSTAMLRALDGEQRAVLLAHERSHLRNRHSWLRSVVGLAAAVHPLLGRIGEQLDVVLERWADEEAALAVASRPAAARSLGRTALVTLHLTPIGEASGGGHPGMDGVVPARVAALCADAPRSRWLAAFATAALMTLMTAVAAEAGHDLEALFDPGSPSHHSAVP